MARTKKEPKPIPMELERGRKEGPAGSGRGLVPVNRDLDVPYNSYLNELDPAHNPDVQFALATSNDIRFQAFLRAMSMPRFKRASLAKIANHCDISLPQFHQFWQSAQRNIALARAQSALPNIISDMAIDAASKNTACGRCDGQGLVLDADNSNLESDPRVIRTKPCPTCKGTGLIREVGNAHARDRLLEVGGLTKKDKGAGVSIVQHFGGATMASAVDSLNKITFDVVDVEPEQEEND